MDYNMQNSPDEEDPLVKYLREVQAKKNPTDNAEYQKAMGDSYRQQNFMNDMIEGITKGGAQIGTIGGKSAQGIYQKPQDPRIMDMQQQNMENDAEAKKQQLYASLAGKISERNAKRDELMASRNIREQERKDDREFRAGENALARQQQAMMFKERGLDRQESKDARAAQALSQQDEKMQKLKTPYGLANTEDDSKQLKAAHESKQNFDSKVQEMIDLRKKYGGELWNREAVARGKQLSKDLLLEYKNMQKLGVLSKSDEDIINAIIPDDPLAFTASSVVGQDPILSNLEKFKGDAEKDFQTRVKTRTRQGISDYESNPPMTAGGSGPETVKMQAPDGSVRMVPKDQVQAAIKAGGRLFDAPSMAGR